MEKMQGTSKDLLAENIEKVKALFPEAFTENKIDFEVLQELLGQYIDKEKERYSFTWAGKQKARREAQKVSTGTLRPCKEESVNFDTTENLYIEGDNLEVLKLLQKSYHNSIKMIYIDPPYNTGKDFVYKDNYHDNLKNYKEITGQLDSEGKKLSTNSDSAGRYHSNWLNMMYPRLKLARNLLKDDGVIFISIGVDEFSNLKKICDIIFGEDNFIEVFSWVKTSTPPALSTKSRKTNEYILCYEKNRNNRNYQGEKLLGGDQPLLNSGNNVRKLIFPKNIVFFNTNIFENGILEKSKPDRVELVNDIEIIDGYSSQDIILRGEFKWTQNFLDIEIEKGTTFVIKSKKLSIRFIRDEEGFKRPNNFISEKYSTPVINKKDHNVGTNETGSSELKGIFGISLFDNPKPISLIKYLVNFIVDDNDIILDFFSGSATTAHAALDLNKEDGGNRKFIMVQLPEPTDEKSEAFKAGYKTIAEIGKERIRRVIQKMQNSECTIDNEKKSIDNGQLKIDNLEESKNSELSIMNSELEKDLGFKVFKLDTSNIKPWNPQTKDLEADLPNVVDNIVEDRTEEDVLYEIMLKYGLELTLPIEKFIIHNGELKMENGALDANDKQDKELSVMNSQFSIYSVGMGALIACLNDNITLEIIEEIGKLKEEINPEKCRVVFIDKGFKDDEIKTNAMHILARYGIEEIRSI
ncbi:site-specific DNA-methyltransferase [bacterium]|nr:site-specific DNA-methyltransferase [bacterium]